MACAETPSLWPYAAGELPPSEREKLAAHLAACDDCRLELKTLEETRALLAEAREAQPPEVDWSRVDAGLRAVRSGKPAPRRVDWTVGFAVAMAAAAVLVLVTSRGKAPVVSEIPSPPVAQVEPKVLPPLPQPLTVVELAEAALVADGTAPAPVASGAALHAGAKLTTPARGKLLVRLPDQSRLELGASASATLARADTDDVAVALETGRVAVQASHERRKAFVVEARGLTVRVVGTAFTVEAGAKSVEVAVGEGKVVVEPARGEARFVEAGERVSFDLASGSAKAGGLEDIDRRELADLGVELAKPKPSPKRLADAGDKKVERAPAPPSPAVEPPSAANEPPLPKVEAPQPAMPASAEDLFLKRAEQSLGHEDCGKFLAGLEELIEHSDAPVVKEKGRILRARCYDDKVLPVEADAEYRRYLRDFPAGQFAAEARKAVAH